MLEKLIGSYEQYYDINRETPVEPFVAEATFKSHGEEYFLIRSAKINEMDSSETAFFADVEELDERGYDMKKSLSQILFEAYPKVRMEDVDNFSRKHIAHQKKVYMCLGKEADMDFDALAKFGKVKKLTLEQIFGY